MYSSQTYCFGHTDILFYEKIMLHALTSFYIKTFRSLFTDIQYIDVQCWFASLKQFLKLISAWAMKATQGMHLRV